MLEEFHGEWRGGVGNAILGQSRVESMWFLSHSPGRTVRSAVGAGHPTGEACSYSMAEVLGNLLPGFS